MFTDTPQNRAKSIKNMQDVLKKFLEEHPGRKVPREFKDLMPKPAPKRGKKIPDYGYKKYYA